MPIYANRASYKCVFHFPEIRIKPGATYSIGIEDGEIQEEKGYFRERDQMESE